MQYVKYSYYKIIVKYFFINLFAGMKHTKMVKTWSIKPKYDLAANGNTVRKEENY